jgi:hypothetical protein
MRHVENAVEVDRHDVLPILDHRFGIGGEGIAAVDAGIVDEDRSWPTYAQRRQRRPPKRPMISRMRRCAGWR